MALTTGDKVGIGIGAAVTVAVIYELVRPKKEFAIFSAVDRHLYKGTNYNVVVNSAGGYNEQISGKDYFIYTTGSGSETPTATGFAYLWGSPLTSKGEPIPVTLASIGYTPPSGIKVA